MRIQPTIDELITAALIGIASHPTIQNPDVYYPAIDPNAPPQPVAIKEFRDFGGLNLDGPDDGLTCSVYPYYSSRNPRTGTPHRIGLTAKFEPQVLGQRQDGRSYDAATYTLIVELAYKDSGLGLPLTLTYAVADSPYLRVANHAYGYTTANPTQVAPQPLDAPVSWQVDTVVIRTNPAEKVLRQYLDRLRYVLADLPTLQPFNVRHTQVTGYDLFTSNWLQEGTNVYFHIAYLVWEIHLYVPNSPY